MIVAVETISIYYRAVIIDKLSCGTHINLNLGREGKQLDGHTIRSYIQRK